MHAISAKQGKPMFIFLLSNVGTCPAAAKKEVLIEKITHGVEKIINSNAEYVLFLFCGLVT